MVPASFRTQKSGLPEFAAARNCGIKNIKHKASERTWQNHEIPDENRLIRIILS